MTYLDLFVLPVLICDCGPGCRCNSHCICTPAKTCGDRCSCAE
jgi:hypothetical protein